MLLSFLLLPLTGALLLALQRDLGVRSAGRFAMIWSIFTLFITCGLGSGLEWTLPWLPESGMNLRFKLDGIAFLFVVLTSLLTVFSVVASFLYAKGDRIYFALILVLQSALFGVFTARHFIPWFLAWEMTLIPSYFLIRLWGGVNAPRAALRFFMMTLGGSALMLAGFLTLQIAVGTMDFDRLGMLASEDKLASAMSAAFGGNGHTLLTAVALAVFVGLAVKIPIVPFHAWLPAAYAEAPTPVTLLLTGLLSKMGVYGMLRVFLPVFPEVLPALAPLLTWLAVATVLLGAFAALSQTDLKRMLAYSSVNHLGYCVLAIAAVATMQRDRNAIAAALSGIVLQAFNHGIIASTLFLGIGVLENRSQGLRGLNDFGGLRARMPVFCGLFGIAVFASVGLPGLGGFVGEFLIFRGAFGTVPLAAVVSVIGLLLTAVFLLRMLRNVFTGPLAHSVSKFNDLVMSERWLFGLAVFFIVIYGLSPGLLLRFANPAILEWLDWLSPSP